MAYKKRTKRRTKLEGYMIHYFSPEFNDMDNVKE
jgi:hypothetical protein